MYNPLFALSVLGKSCEFSSGLFSFANLVPANAASHTRTHYPQAKKPEHKQHIYFFQQKANAKK